jgi:hypothetical protein
VLFPLRALDLPSLSKDIRRGRIYAPIQLLLFPSACVLARTPPSLDERKQKQWLPGEL